MTGKFWRPGAIITGILAASGLVVVSLWGVAGQSSAHDVPTLSQDTKASLTVSPADLLPDSALCKDDTFIKNSIIGVKAGDNSYQQWSDSVSIPFKSSDKDGMMKEVTTENCGNPTFLDMNIKALKSITIDGWNVGDHNSWMSEFLAKADKEGLRTAFLTKKAGEGDKVFVTSDYQKYAALTNTLLSRFQNVGVVTQTSLTNWHLPGGGLVTGELVRTELNPKQEDLPLLKLELTEKGQGCVWAGGYNTMDKRFETVSCEVPKPPAPPAQPATPTTPGTPSNGCTENCGGTPPETHVCPPEMPHGTWPVCKDDPSRDPEQQGNNKPGGGGQAPTQTDPVGPPAGGEPPQVYVPPTKVQEPAPEVKPQPQPGPAPTVDPGKQDTNNGTITTPDPGTTCTQNMKDFGLC